MTDLNTFLLEELAEANAHDRPPCFHVSTTLTIVINQVHVHGQIAHSFNDGQDFLDFIDIIGLQFHPFNLTKTAAINAADYELLDAQQKFVLSHVMDEVIGEDTLIVGDAIGVNRLFLGPVNTFQQFDPVTGHQSLTAGQHPLIPTFRLPTHMTFASHSVAQYGGIMPLPLPTSQLLTPDAADQTLVAEVPQKSAERIPRPPNPFIIYRAAHHKSVADAHPEASNNEISKKIGRQWQQENDETRQMYRDKAAEIKAAFMAAHPEYKYQPRKSSEVKRRCKRTVTDAKHDEKAQEK